MCIRDSRQLVHKGLLARPADLQFLPAGHHQGIALDRRDMLLVDQITFVAPQKSFALQLLLRLQQRPAALDGICLRVDVYKRQPYTFLYPPTLKQR